MERFDVVEPDGFGSIGGFSWRCGQCDGVNIFTSSLVTVLAEQVRSHEAWHRERAAEALIAKLEQRPGRVWSEALDMRIARPADEPVLKAPDGWRAFYGDPSLSDEERRAAEYAESWDESNAYGGREMSGMELYREHTGHGEGS